MSESSDRLRLLERAQVLVDASHPFLGHLIGLNGELWRLDHGALRRRDAEVLEHAAHCGVGALGELLVGELQRLVSKPEEVRVPGGVVRGKEAYEVVDRAKGEDELGRAAALLACLAAARFPAANGPSRLMLPIIFGAPITR